MHRRQALQACSTVLAVGFVGGCLDDGGSLATTGDDDSPLDDDPESLLLSEEVISDVLRDGWVAEEPEGISMVSDADAAVHHIPFDQDAGEFHSESGRITSGAWLYEDVETAQAEFADHPYQEGWGYDEHPIAVECIGGTTDDHSDTRVVFRDANVIGGVQYENRHVEVETREERGLELAARMHESWRSG